MMRSRPLVLCGLLLLALSSCAVEADEHLPTRAYTPIPLPTATITPFSIPAQSYYEEGLLRQQAGDLAGAVQSYSAALVLRPRFGAALVARGSVYLAQGEHRRALADAGAALDADAEDASAALLRAETLRQMGRGASAQEAYDLALALDPRLRAETFHSRWLTARAAHDGERLQALSREYAARFPDDALRHYYAGWAQIEAGRAISATETLGRGIETARDAPAVLWFALGHAYVASSAWQEAVIAFEVARALAEQGDTSLALHSDEPSVDLMGMLGRAYLAVGRCVDAEAMLTHALEIGCTGSDYGAFVEQARLCQTPTPLPTPYPTITPSLP